MGARLKSVALRTDLVSSVRILSLSCVYPNPAQPVLGTFVRARLEHLARLVPLKILAPVAVWEYGNPTRRRKNGAAVPKTSTEGGADVFRPRWFYPPLGGVLNAAFLFARTAPVVGRIRRTFRFDAIDAHFAYPDGIAAGLLARLFRCPYVVTLRGNETMHARYPFRGSAIAWSIRGASCVITVSERLRRFAIDCGAEPARVRTIPNGVDIGVFHPRPACGVRESLGLPANRRMVLSAGYLIERKGHHRVMHAVAGLRERGVDADLVIAGAPGAEGEFAPVLARLVGELGLSGHVHFTGALKPERLAELMSAADVLCLASSREGWPNVVNEALACGTPVVATDIGGVPEMIPSPAFGAVVPAGDADALSGALGEALRRNWDRCAIAKWGMSRSWDRVAAEVLSFLREHIEQRTAR